MQITLLALDPSEILNFVIIICLIVLTYFIATLIYQVTQTVKLSNSILEDVKDTTQDLRNTKDTIKTKVISTLIKIFKK